MRKVLIVGAGQSGLQLALSLREHDYDVTVISARTPNEIREGRVMSTQCMFHTALQHERDHGINFWEEDAPRIGGLNVSIAGEDGRPMVEWLGRLDNHAQSVDQRVKMAGWMEAFERKGGNLVIHGVTVSDLDRFVSLYDLVVVAAGRGELVELFGRDESRSPYTEPQRSLAVSYVRGMERPEHLDREAVRITLIPGVGELFIMPALTTTGACDILFFEGIPGGPLDRFADIRDPREHLDTTLDLMRQFVPWEYQRCGAVELTDAHGTLQGRFPPTVRYPIGRLPSGGAVLGMADVVVANDPIVGQGSNNASKCAAIYLSSILEQGDRPFDEEFMQRTFDAFWDDVQYSTTWSNAMLQPPPPHALQLLGAGGEHQELADRFANGFNNPKDLFEWFMDPEKGEAYLAELQSRATAV